LEPDDVVWGRPREEGGAWSRCPGKVGGIGSRRLGQGVSRCATYAANQARSAEVATHRGGGRRALPKYEASTFVEGTSKGVWITGSRNTFTRDGESVPGFPKASSDDGMKSVHIEAHGHDVGTITLDCVEKGTTCSVLPLCVAYVPPLLQLQ
jgi:hypothetical protein